MKKIAVLFHSGVGVTKKVANNIAANLSEKHDTEIFSVEELQKEFNPNVYDGFVIGFPVIHAHPSDGILNFIGKLDRLDKPKPAYLFTTCGWYSTNSLRIFAKHCIQKNIVPVIHRVFWGCPATDGVLLFPFITRLFRFPKNINNHITNDVNIFGKKLESGKIVLNMPKFKLYSILTYPIKLTGQAYTFPIYIHSNKCTKCGKCMSDCPSNALKKGSDDYPVFHSKNCEKCYRCIHHCPQKALSLSKHRTPKKLLKF